MRKLICLAIVLTFLISYKHAAALDVDVNLEKMAIAAGKIFSGKCRDVKKGFHPQYKNVKVTFVEFDLFDSIKGASGPTIKFMQFGHGHQMPYASKFRTGEEALIFIYPKSQYGFTSAVGGNQGKFSITRDKDTGKPAFVNAFNQNSLFKGMDSKDIGDVNLSGNINYEVFLRAVRSIIEKHEKGGGK